MSPPGPNVTDVGTASASMTGGAGNGRWSVGVASTSKRATVQASPSGVTRMMSLPAASATSASPFGAIVRPYPFDLGRVAFLVDGVRIARLVCRQVEHLDDRAVGQLVHDRTDSPSATIPQPVPSSGLIATSMSVVGSGTGNAAPRSRPAVRYSSTGSGEARTRPG